MRRDAYVTAEKVKNAYPGFGDEYRLLTQSFDEYLTDFEWQRVGKDRSAGTLGQYRYSRDKVAAFLEYKYHVSDIAFKELTPDFIKEYYIYLRTVCNLRQGTIHKILKKLKLMTYTVHKNGWIPANPFCDFKIAPEYGDRHFLTEKELQRVINVHLLHYKSRIIRNIFVFCCLTGLSVCGHA